MRKITDYISLRLGKIVIKARELGRDDYADALIEIGARVDAGSVSILRNKDGNNDPATSCPDDASLRQEI